MGKIKSFKDFNRFVGGGGGCLANKETKKKKKWVGKERGNLDEIWEKFGNFTEFKCFTPCVKIKHIN